MFYSFKTEFEILYAAHTMNCDGPDFEAFESDLCAIIWARGLGMAAACVSNLSTNASDPQMVGTLSKENSQR